ncbi:MAG: acyclic terpene utilization AtuA family protein [Thermodesulfobacteriota bacterium]|nr:acyclic terpene utilization AtuA family protein [Thermodesulfobacteriota bacterium]
MKAKHSLKILSPTAILGYGFPEESFIRGIAMKPDLIAVDAGSVDPGPYYLGSGVSFTDPNAVKRDLTFMIREGRRLNVPVIVGSCGGSGALPHLEWTREIVLEIINKLHVSARIGLIYADIDKQDVVNAIRNGRTEPLAGLPELTEKTVEESVNIVAQMGVEPFIAALEKKCDIILAGRAYDPAVFAALPIKEGFDPGLAIHMGKILECAAIAADPGSGSDCVMGILEKDSFTLVPLSDERRFTEESTAAHSLYEKADPYCLPGPGGYLDLRNVTFTEEQGGRVMVKGSMFVPAEKPCVKLEAARKVGYRTVSIAGTRDPIMISQIDEILENILGRVTPMFESEGIKGRLYFHIYGKDAVMGTLEPVRSITSHEIGIVIEAVAPTQEQANSICSVTRSTLLHYGYPGRIATAGNLAFPFSPSDIKAGPVYEFSIYHLMEVMDQSIFKTSIIEL